MPEGKGLAKIYMFNQEKLKFVPKGESLAKIYRFSQEKLKIVPKRKGLANKIWKLCQKEKV